MGCVDCLCQRNLVEKNNALTPPQRPSTPLCHTYSEPSGHEGLHGTQYMAYLLKKEPIAIPVLWAISELRSADCMVKSTICLSVLGDFCVKSYYILVGV